MVYDPYQILLAIQNHAEFSVIMQSYATDYSQSTAPDQHGQALLQTGNYGRHPGIQNTVRAEHRPAGAQHQSTAPQPDTGAQHRSQAPAIRRSTGGGGCRAGPLGDRIVPGTPA